MESWIYQGRDIRTLEDLPNHETIIGFVYKITNLKTRAIYIGKKNLHHSRKTKISKKEKTETKTRKVFKTVVKESDWQSYYGSSIELKKDVELFGKKQFRREIIELCCTKKYLNYSELAYQIRYDVLNTDSYNGNILGKYYSKDMQNCFKN
jgi:hypothetical protein